MDHFIQLIKLPDALPTTQIHQGNCVLHNFFFTLILLITKLQCSCWSKLTSAFDLTKTSLSTDKALGYSLRGGAELFLSIT